MKIRLKLLLSVLFFVLLYASYYWGIPAVLDIEQRSDTIQKIVKKEFGLDIQIKSPTLKMGLAPNIWLNASSFSVLDEKSSPFFIEKPKLKIKLLPLLFGKIQLSYFSCDKITADFKIDKSHRFYIGNYLIVKSSDSKISVEDSKMDIQNYKIRLKDEIQNKEIFLNGDYFNLKRYNSKKYITLSTNSTLIINKNPSIINMDIDFKLPFKSGFNTNKITFSGTVTNLDLADLSSYLKKISKNKIKNVSGVLNIQADTKVLNRKVTQIITQMTGKNLLIDIKDNHGTIFFKDKLNINTTLNISKNTFGIRRFDISSGNININFSGEIDKVDSKEQILDLEIKVNKSRIEDIVALLPARNFKDVNINFTALKKYGYYGNIDGNLLIKGKAGKPDVKGNFVSTEGYVIKPLDIPKANVNLEFLGEKFYMDVLVPTSKTEKVRVKGYIDLYGEQAAALDISSTPNVDLEIAESILLPVHEIFQFDLGPLPVMKLQGLGNINLKVKGTKKDPHLSGQFNFRNTTASFEGINAFLKNGEGALYFQDKETYFVTDKALLDSKTIDIEGKCSLKGVLDFNVKTNNQNLEFLFETLKKSPMLADFQKNFPEIKKTDGKVNLNIKLKGQVKNINDFVIGKTIILSGNIKLTGVNVLADGLQIQLKNLFGNIKFNNKDADLDLISSIDKSKVYIKGKIKNNVLNLKMKLDDVSFSYANIPVKVLSGNLEINNNKLTLYKVNALFDSMPFLVDGFITDIFTAPDFNLYVNSKPNQRFIDGYINKNSIYPLKIKGDILYSAKVHGVKDAYNIQAEINLSEDSNIYYMGSTLGDANNPIRIFIDANVSKNSVYVNNFQYDKLISSQNNKEFTSQQLNAKGRIDFNNKDIILQNFRIKTQNPTDAKIFNILFKKPLIKQGLFNANLVINQSIMSPKMIGFLNFTGIDIPILDTTVKDISLNFLLHNIDIKAKGDVFANKITFFAAMENKLTPPYVLNALDIYLGNLDINDIIKSLNKVDAETSMRNLTGQNSELDLQNLIIKQGKLKADSVFIRNIFAKDLTAEFSISERLLFSLEKFNFYMSEGQISGSFNYNLLNSNSSLKLNVEKANANSLAEALFDLKNQIYGSLTGQASLICNGKTRKTCMDTLSGKGGFRVSNGRMPKLGSLEYLLKAANLLKSGITGLTINSVIDLITPLKTGEFENINGDFQINSGTADYIQIFSRGKDLSLFLTGKYNFSTLIADMEVFGRISKKISTVLGPVGNASLNTLFNTIPGLNLDETNKPEFVKNINNIPGLELNDKTYRIFSAKIYGDINGENYVQSFKWIE